MFPLYEFDREMVAVLPITYATAKMSARVQIDFIKEDHLFTASPDRLPYGFIMVDGVLHPTSIIILSRFFIEMLFFFNVRWIFMILIISMLGKMLLLSIICCCIFNIILSLHYIYICLCLFSLVV